MSPVWQALSCECVHVCTQACTLTLPFLQPGAGSPGPPLPWPLCSSGPCPRTTVGPHSSGFHEKQNWPFLMTLQEQPRWSLIIGGLKSESSQDFKKVSSNRGF